MIAIHIETLKKQQSNLIKSIVKILQDAFIHTPEYEKEEKLLLNKIKQTCEFPYISRVAYDEKQQVLGWISGMPHYEGQVWELHPLAVHPAYQRLGVGKKLVHDFEKQVKQRGGITIYLGTDDTWGGTSLFGKNLYLNPWKHIQQITNLDNHPYEFYLKLGYSIVGVVPDANGLGKPDILMAKRVKS